MRLIAVGLWEMVDLYAVRKDVANDGEIGSSYRLIYGVSYISWRSSSSSLFLPLGRSCYESYKTAEQC
jgi:hypothetical protein